MKHRKNSQPKKTVAEILAAKILDQMSAGVLPWRTPWKTGPEGPVMPQNFKTGYPYRGINLFICCMAPSPYFLTFKQIKEMGGRVKKGAESWPICFFSKVHKDKNGKPVEKRDEEGRSFAFMKYYPAFCANDIEGIDFPVYEIDKLENFNPLPIAAEIVSKRKPVVTHASHFLPCYIPSTDITQMPLPEQFVEESEYYSTLFHELAHWTGHEKRLSRLDKYTKGGSTSKKEYGREELVAELAAVIMCQLSGITSRSVYDNSVSYINDWVKLIKENPSQIITAAADAQKAVDYLTAGTSIDTFKKTPIT